MTGDMMEQIANLQRENMELKKQVEQMSNLLKANCPFLTEEERKNAFMAYREAELKDLNEKNTLSSMFK